MVCQLVEPEGEPELAVGRRPAHPLDDVLLSPVDVIVDKEFSNHDRDAHDEGGRHNEERDCRGDRMNARMDDATRVPVGSLVNQLPAALKRIVAHEVLDDQDQENGDQRRARLTHVPTLDCPFFSAPDLNVSTEG